MKDHNKKYYEENKKKQSEKNLKRYYYNQETKRFRNILLDKEENLGKKFRKKIKFIFS